MASPSVAPILFLTNTVYGESTYEETLWRGASLAGSRVEAPFCTVVGGQLTPDASGHGLKVPFLFQLAARFRAQGAVINAGTLQQGVSHEDLERFIVQFPQASKVVTAIPMGKMSSVVVDNFAGMKALVEFLVTDLGKRRVAYVSGPLSNTEALERLRAYREVIGHKGLPVAEELVFEGNWTGQSGALAADHFLDKKIEFDAVACANDLMAIGLLEQLLSRGISVPSQVVVTGFDDIDAARYTIPQLTTVFQPIGELGERAVEALTGRDRPSSARLTVPARLVLRASAAAVETDRGPASGASQAGGDGDRWLAYLNELRAQQDRSSWLARTLEWMGTCWLSGTEPSLASAGALMKDSVPDDHESFVKLVRMLNAGLPRFLDSSDQWRRATQLLQLLTEAHRDYQFHAYYLVAKKNESVTASLIGVNRILNQVSRSELLEPALVEALSLCGIATGHVVLIDSSREGATARTVASVVEGRGQQAQTRARPFSPETIVEGGLPSGNSSNWLLLPLSFEGQDLGYMVFGVAPVSAFLYESLANLVSGVLHSVLLIEKIKAAEAAAARRADKIDELVRPMIEALKTTGASAKQQGIVMAALVQANAETAQKLSGMDRHVVRMKEALEQVVGLIGTIEEVSETISVIAINAAIAAARAGANGKVFGVISAEIRKLSVQTKMNTGQITQVLEELGSQAQTFFDANAQTRRVFSQLESEIRQLVGSLQSIQNAMESMNGQARLVLETMAEA